MNNLTKEVLEQLASLKKRDQNDLICNQDDFEVLFLASLIEEEESNGR